MNDNTQNREEADTPESLRRKAGERRASARATREGAAYADGQAHYREMREASRLDGEAAALERRAAELEQAKDTDPESERRKLQLLRLAYGVARRRTAELETALAEARRHQRELLDQGRAQRQRVEALAGQERRV